MKPLPSRLESFWIGVIAGFFVVLALAPEPAKGEPVFTSNPQIGGVARK